MHLNPRTVFLLDGLGAVVSATCLGLILPRIQPRVGMPSPIIHTLALVAAFLASYSLACCAFADCTNPRWLRLIISFNLAYCLLTLVLVATLFSQLTWLELGYFGAESLVILALVWLERACLTRMTGPVVMPV